MDNHFMLTRLESLVSNSRLLLSLMLLMAGSWTGLLLAAVADSATGTVSGVVVDTQGPFAGATVRVRATENVSYSGSNGGFTLASLVEGQPVEITAWADGYYIAGTIVTPSVSSITLTLRPYHTVDHPAYLWTSPVSGTSAGACGNCHPMVFEQWRANAHGGAIANPRFFSMYSGSDVTGTAQVAPGYLDDFPNTAGICADCHAPGAGVDGYLTTDMLHVRDTITAGIHCDYCHKVGGVYLNPATRSVYPNAPGVRSQRLLRPPPGDNIFFGPFDDIPDPDTYLPQISESAFCAPCHQFEMWGTPIYSSYQEWLESPYAAAGITCQDCHMPPNGDSHFALPEAGGLAHPPEQIPSHLQLGASSSELLQRTVEIGLFARQEGEQIRVTVILTNSGAGHHVPTDYPGRHLLLVVSGSDEDGAALVRQSGPAVPQSGGDLAGNAGKLFAKILEDVASGQSPVVNYWKQTRIVDDNRIAALASDTSVYTFSVPSVDATVTVTARLLLRRLFHTIASRKGWQVADRQLAEESVQIEVRPTLRIYLPMVE